MTGSTALEFTALYIILHDSGSHEAGAVIFGAIHTLAPTRRTQCLPSMNITTIISTLASGLP